MKITKHNTIKLEVNYNGNQNTINENGAGNQTV